MLTKILDILPLYSEFELPLPDESFMRKNNEQIGVGVSPGDENYESPYLYVNPYPFNENIVDQSLPIGKWHTSGWNGIKVEWRELENKIEQEIASEIYDRTRLRCAIFD